MVFYQHPQQTQDKHLRPPNTRFQVSLEHAGDNFRLHASTVLNNYKLEVLEAKLLVTRVKIREEIQKPFYHHWRTLSQGIPYFHRNVPILGPFHIGSSVFNVPPSNPIFLDVGTTSFDRVINRAQRPQLMMAVRFSHWECQHKKNNFQVIIATDAIMGVRNKTPFHFVHLQIKSIQAKFEDVFYPSNAYEPVFPVNLADHDYNVTQG